MLISRHGAEDQVPDEQGVTEVLSGDRAPRRSQRREGDRQEDDARATVRASEESRARSLEETAELGAYSCSHGRDDPRRSPRTLVLLGEDCLARPATASAPTTPAGSIADRTSRKGQPSRTPWRRSIRPRVEREGPSDCGGR